MKPVESNTPAPMEQDPMHEMTLEELLADPVEEKKKKKQSSAHPKAAKEKRSSAARKSERAERRLKKKQRKAEKKEIRRKKKEAKKNRFVLYDPKKMQGFPFSVAVGYFLRFFSIGFSIFGVLWLFCDAFALTDVKAIPLLTYCVAMVSAFSMIFIGKWLTLGGFALLGAWVGGFFALYGNLLTFYVSGVGKVYNAMMYRLTEEGFAAAVSITLPDFGGLAYDDALLTYGGVYALATVFALVFAAFSAKRTRLFPMLILGGGLCAVCFTYNLCRTNWGIACVLAGLASAAVLSSYDKIYKAHKKSKKSRAYSGYSSALAGLLALAIVSLPASNVSSQWKNIEFISGPIEEARTYLTTILTGGNPAYNKMNTLHEKRSNKLESVEFDGVTLFTVTAPLAKTVYLRSWVADDYDYATDEWSVLDSTDYSSMLRQLTVENSGFSGDQVTYDLYSLMDVQFLNDSFSQRGYVSRSAFGYLAAFVNVEYVENTGQLFVLPSSYAAPLGLYEYGSRTEPYADAMALHADGIWSSGWFSPDKSYTAPAIMPTYMNATYGEVAERQARYYTILVDTINELHKQNSPDVDAAIAAFELRLERERLSEFSSEALRYYLDMGQNGRARFYSRYVRLVREYSDYVQKFYSEYPSESKAVQDILKQLDPLLQKAPTTHDKIMVIIDYLADHYEYTLTPTQPKDPTGSALDAFLTETKNGYCVQFASAATLLLRAAGLPARYVQGYLATDFSGESTPNGDMEYTADVLDSDAHAWVEVYIEGLGWRSYETTPAYYEDIYFVGSTVGPDTSPDQTTPVTTPPVTTPPPVETTPPDTEPPLTTRPPVTTPASSEAVTTDDGISSSGEVDMAEIMRVFLGLCLIGLLALLLLWQIRRANKVVDGRRHFIERSVYGTFEEKADFDRVASVLCDSIFEVHAILGNRPYIGELPGEFAARVDRLSPDAAPGERRRYERLSLLPSTFSDVMTLIQKQEFGRALTRQELETLGVYLSALIDSEYAHLNPFKKIWYRYIRFMI